MTVDGVGNGRGERPLGKYMASEKSELRNESTSENSARTPSTLKSWQSPFSSPRCLVARVLCHPELSRLGEFAILFDGDRSGRAEISRLTPPFRRSDGGLAGALETPFLSRLPLTIDRSPSGDLTLECDPRLSAATVDGPATGNLRFSAAQVREGITLALGSGVVLYIAETELTHGEPGLEAIVGESLPGRTMRRQLTALVNADKPVLLVGEDGVGKTAIAKVLHEESGEGGRPLITVPMVTVDGRVLVGDALDREGELGGAFMAAQGGTLLLDGLQHTPTRRRGAVARAIAQGLRAQRGAREASRVRVIATCTAPKDRTLVDRLLPDYHEVPVPALRSRREDIPLLFVDYARRHLEWLRSSAQRATRDEGALRLPAELVLSLMARDWPGNVMQVRRVAEQLAFDFHTSGRIALDASVADSETESPRRPPSDRPPALTLTNDEVMAALEQNDFAVARTAKYLGVSKAWLHLRLANSPLPRGADLLEDDIRSAIAAEDGDVRAAARRLRVSKHALSLRMSQLGISLN